MVLAVPPSSTHGLLLRVLRTLSGIVVRCKSSVVTMLWAWITVPYRRRLQVHLVLRLSGRDSRVHSTAAVRRRVLTCSRLSEPRVAAYYSRSMSI